MNYSLKDFVLRTLNGDPRERALVAKEIDSFVESHHLLKEYAKQLETVLEHLSAYVREVERRANVNAEERSSILTDMDLNIEVPDNLISHLASSERMGSNLPAIEENTNPGRGRSVRGTLEYTEEMRNVSEATGTELRGPNLTQEEINGLLNFPEE